MHGDMRQTKTSQALAVLQVSALAFTESFMVWMVYGVIGIPKENAGAEYHRVRPAHRLADPGAAGHQSRRPTTSPWRHDLHAWRRRARTVPARAESQPTRKLWRVLN